MSNVIFLDVDGVLNSRFWEDEHQREISDGKYLDIDSVKFLKLDLCIFLLYSFVNKRCKPEQKSRSHL